MKEAYKMSQFRMFKNFKMYLILALFLWLSCENFVFAEQEYYSSVSSLENLLQTEVVVLAELQEYLDSLENHIDALRSEISIVQEEHHAASQDLEGYLNNPVNAYRLIKRLHSDWANYEESIRVDMSRTNFLDAMAQYRQNFSFPTDEDAIGSATALVRLQDTYKLNVAEVASGVLNGVKYGSSMSWQDCFFLGYYLYENNDFNHTVPWLKQSMQLLMEDEHNNDEAVSLDFVETVASYHQEMGDYTTALDLIQYILNSDPSRQHMYETKAHLERMITDGIKQGSLHDIAPTLSDYHLSDEYKLYQQVCRNELKRNATAMRPLRCKYHTNNVAYRILQPFKMEEHNLEPYIVQFYNVITDKEIQAVKAIAKPRMLRSLVRSEDGTSAKSAGFRTSKSAWFRYNRNRHMKKMLRHVGDFSGLNIEQAEDLQVANYGIGGHYEPHYDFFTDDISYQPEDGNRIATAIYYLSDVEEGGGTAFPYMHFQVKPKKGSVLFWYNLHRSEERDYRTKHAACPVLKGSKWIGNIWLRVRNQDRERPCDLQPDHELSLAFKDYA